MRRYVLLFLAGLFVGALSVSLYMMRREATHPVPTATAEPAPQMPIPTATPPPQQPLPSPSPSPVQPAPEAPLAKMVLPIAGLKPEGLRDDFNEEHSGHKHEAIDILQPRGTPVHAVVDGSIQKLFLSKPGGITIYQFDESSELCYYYAHLDRYAETLKEGMHVTRGDVIGFVGTTGNADPGTPHLHFAILKLGPDKHWWQNTEAIDPYPQLLALAQENR